MTVAIRTIETFSCAHCGAAYLTAKEPWPFVRAGHFDCIYCCTEVHAWSGRFDYLGWTGVAADR
jgi:hypothetical protein